MHRTVEISASYLAGLEAELIRLRADLEVLERRAQNAFDAGYLACSNDRAVRDGLAGERPRDVAIVPKQLAPVVPLVPTSRLTPLPGGLSA